MAVRQVIIAFFSQLFFVANGSGQVLLPSFFSNHMVLQQQSDIKLWGWVKGSDRDVEITCSWLDSCVATEANGDAKWEVTIPTPHAGGPHQIWFVNANDTLALLDVLMGEVWLCAGQSNMELGAKHGLQEMLVELPVAENNRIRLLNVDRISAPFPQQNLSGAWEECDSLALVDFSAVGYFIAKRLQHTLGVPIGIINASWGGTSAEVWVPEELIAGNKMLQGFAELVPPLNYRPHKAGSLWNSMIYPLIPYGIAGVFWYQGESNVQSYDGYDLLFASLIRAWRNAWNKQLPFYYVQIAPFAYGYSEGIRAALLRERQCRILDSLENVGMVVVSDLVPDISEVHPPKKKAVAERLSLLALAEQYGLHIEDYKSPVMESFEIVGNEIIVHFRYCETGLIARGDSVAELYIAGNDRKFYPAQAKVTGCDLAVFSKAVKQPVAVRFGFSDAATPNLFNRKGLPVSPFRTDDWGF